MFCCLWRRLQPRIPIRERRPSVGRDLEVHGKPVDSRTNETGGEYDIPPPCQGQISFIQNNSASVVLVVTRVAESTPVNDTARLFEVSYPSSLNVPE